MAKQANKIILTTFFHFNYTSILIITSMYKIYQKSGKTHILVNLFSVTPHDSWVDRDHHPASMEF